MASLQDAGAVRVVIGGAGPAGLSAAWELARRGRAAVVLEADKMVGGLARTVEHKGCRFDIGGHRFYTKVGLVEKLWREILGEDLLRRRRLSRIYYRGHYFQYPLDVGDVLRGLGPLESLACGLSFVAAQLRGEGTDANLEEWLVRRFGRRLYRTFFQPYTEKVWGIPCREIGAEWAAQRIRGLGVWPLLRRAVLGTGEIRSLIQEFDYPRQGPGMLWERVREQAEAAGARVELGATVERVRWEAGGVREVEAGGRSYAASHFLSSLPLGKLVEALEPAAPAAVREAAGALKYRDFLTVALILKGENPFPDNWIYVHSPAVRVGRIQNYRNWSEEMVAAADLTCLGMEYFCFQGDGLWNKADGELVKLAMAELKRLGLAGRHKLVEGVVVRMPRAYPVYFNGHAEVLATIREFVGRLPNLHPMGRNGMHRYNNQDHSMLTGLLAARNVLGEEHDLWAVNMEEDYLE